MDSLITRRRLIGTAGIAGGATLARSLTLSTVHTFSRVVGAQQHDAPMAPQRRNEVVFNWLDARLR